MLTLLHLRRLLEDVPVLLVQAQHAQARALVVVLVRAQLLVVESPSKLYVPSVKHGELLQLLD